MNHKISDSRAELMRWAGLWDKMKNLEGQALSVAITLDETEPNDSTQFSARQAANLLSELIPVIEELSIRSSDPEEAAKRLREIADRIDG